MAPVKIRCCPQCRSKRVRQLTRLSEAYCPLCNVKFSVTAILPDACSKCGGEIIDRYDPKKAVHMANNTFKHVRCPRKKRPKVAV